MIGQTVSQYKILEKLGEGGMGVVYKARDTKLDRFVALKFLPQHLTANHTEKARFLQEAKAAAALNHPNVCSVIDLQEANGQQFIIMEYVEGRTLHKTSPVRELSDVIAFASQIAEALQAAHNKGIVHRDVKADNIMVTPDGRIKVMDFGLAKLKGSLKLTRTSSTVGTLAYMAPEQIQGGEVDARSDLFSFGVVMFEMLTGKLPFHGDHEAALMYSIVHEEPESLGKYRADVSAVLTRAVSRLLQKDAEKRYQTAGELLAELKNADAPAATRKGSPVVSIAVLAFEDMSPQKDHDYLCEGLAEEVINALTKIGTLQVSARTSAFAFRGKQVDIREIGMKLNVQAVLEGSVRKSGNRLRITAQLINVADGYHLWSERYDREMKDVFEIQDEITENIVRALKVVLTDEKPPPTSFPTPYVEAYEYYLRGRRLFHLHSGKYGDPIKMFLRATEIDAQYPLAYCGLADCYAFRYMFREGTEANLNQAERASRKAIEINPQLAEAHTSLGLAFSLKKNYEEAEREFEKAISLNPRLFEVHYYSARMYFERGDSERAAKSFEEAIRIRPEEYQAQALVAGVYRDLGDKQKYMDALSATIQKVERHLELNPDDARAYVLGGSALLQSGQVERGEKWLDRALEIEPDSPGIFYNTACVFALLGKSEKAIDCLRQALKFGFARKEWIEHDSDLESLRSDSRFQELLQGMKPS